MADPVSLTECWIKIGLQFPGVMHLCWPGCRSNCHTSPPQRLISDSLRPNGSALTFQNRPILKQNLLGSTVCEPTSERCRPPPSPGTLAQSGPARGAMASRGGNRANAMRSILALGVLIALCTSANAAKVHHFRMRDHVTIQPSQGPCVPPTCYKFPGYPPLPPEAIRTHDPSTFGGG